MKTLDFLELFPGRVCYATLDDKRVDPGLNHFHEGYDLTRQQILDTLLKENKTRGVFFCVNEIDRELAKGHRNAKMLVNIRAVWIDDDEPRDDPRTDFKIPPSIVVESSPGKFHYYWLTTCDDFNEWDQVMNRLVIDCAGDPASRDRVRILRLPGFKHLKNKAFLSRVVGGNSKKYEWAEIRIAYPPTEDLPLRLTQRDGTTRTGSVSNWLDAKKLVKSGENYHDALRYIGLHKANKGMSFDEVLSDLQDLLELCEYKDDRWKQRCQQLEANAKDWLNFVDDNPIEEDEQFELALPEDTNRQVQMGFPPGLMGELCREILEMSPHPNEEIAIATAFGLIAGIAGRVYNVNNMGTNLYISMVGESGIGKDVVTSAISTAIKSEKLLGQGAFLDPTTSPTGEKGLIQSLHEYPSRIIIDDEAGIAGTTRAGDQATLRAAKMKIYTKSNQGGVYFGKQYSEKTNSIPSVNAPSLTVISASTPDAYYKLISTQEATITGELNRMWLIQTHRNKSYLNRTMRQEFSPPVRERINDLIRFCHGINVKKGLNGGPESPKVVNLNTDMVPFFEDNDKWTDIVNEVQATDPIKAHVANRAHAKIAKIAGVCSVFNDTGNKLGVDEYKWASSAIEEEVRVVSDNILQSDKSDMEVLFTYVVLPRLNEMVKAENSKHQNLFNHNCFTQAMFLRRIRKLKEIRELNGDPSKTSQVKTGAMKVIDHMTTNGYIREVRKDSALATKIRMNNRHGKVYQITRLLELETDIS